MQSGSCRQAGVGGHLGGQGGGHTGLHAGAHGGGQGGGHGLHAGGHGGHAGGQGGGHGLHAGGHGGHGGHTGGQGLHTGGQGWHTGGQGWHTGGQHTGGHDGAQVGPLGCSQHISSGQQLLFEHPDQKNAIELIMSIVAKIPSFLYISRLLIGYVEKIYVKILYFCFQV